MKNEMDDLEKYFNDEQSVELQDLDPSYFTGVIVRAEQQYFSRKHKEAKTSMEKMTILVAEFLYGTYRELSYQNVERGLKRGKKYPYSKLEASNEFIATNTGLSLLLIKRGRKWLTDHRFIKTELYGGGKHSFRYQIVFLHYLNIDKAFYHLRSDCSVGTSHDPTETRQVVETPLSVGTSHDPHKGILTNNKKDTINKDISGKTSLPGISKNKKPSNPILEKDEFLQKTEFYVNQMKEDIQMEDFPPEKEGKLIGKSTQTFKHSASILYKNHPEFFFYPNLLAEWSRWITIHTIKKGGFTYVGIKGQIEKLIELSHSNPKEALKFIREAANGEWKQIYEPFQNTNGNSKNGKTNGYHTNPSQLSNFLPAPEGKYKDVHKNEIQCRFIKQPNGEFDQYEMEHGIWYSIEKNGRRMEIKNKPMIERLNAMLSQN